MCRGVKNGMSLFHVDPYYYKYLYNDIANSAVLWNYFGMFVHVYRTSLALKLHA